MNEPRPEVEHPQKRPDVVLVAGLATMLVLGAALAAMNGHRKRPAATPRGINYSGYNRGSTQFGCASGDSVLVEPNGVRICVAARHMEAGRAQNDSARFVRFKKPFAVQPDCSLMPDAPSGRVWFADVQRDGFHWDGNAASIDWSCQE